jgi:CRISPR/Cas system-associated exonuclease Cas4 (RecB family)
MSDFLPRSQENLDLDFPSEIEHISASSINMALRCEEQWRQVYVKKLRRPPALAMLAGRADHKAIETSMAQKITTHVDLPVREVQEAFLGALEEAVEESGGINEVVLEDLDYDVVRSQGEDIVGGYHRLISPTVQPLSVEQEFRIEIPGVPVEVLGYIDLTTEDQIIDRKRSKRSPRKVSPDWQLQGGIYQLVEPKPHAWHVSVTSSRPSYNTDLIQEVPTRQITEQRVRDAAWKIGWLYQRYGPDEVWPATGMQHAWACGYCGFKDQCWGWQTTV